MSTKPKTQVAKTAAKPQAAKTAAPAGATVAPVPAAGDLQFDLGNPDAGPTVAIQSPNAAEVFKDFQKTGSVEIEASALMPGIACPFTLGCAEKGGKVRIMSDVTVPRQLPDGKTAVQRAQQFHCRTCGCVAKGVKFIGGAAVGMGGGPKLFNRLTGKSE